MKVIICGGRHYSLSNDDIKFLDYNVLPIITELVSSGCAGADLGGEEWADQNNIPIRRFVPDWNKYGRAAGPMRNEAMAMYLETSGSGMVVAFPGGRGTDNMVDCAVRYGIRVVNPRVNIGEPVKSANNPT